MIKNNQLVVNFGWGPDSSNKIIDLDKNKFYHKGELKKLLFIYLNYIKSMKDLIKEEFYYDNTCYQFYKPESLLSSSPPRECTKSQLKMIRKKGEIPGYHVLYFLENGERIYCQKKYDEPEFKKPILKRCQDGEDPGIYYGNCCPGVEYDTHILKLYLSYKKIDKNEFWKSFEKIPLEERYKMLPKMSEKIKSYFITEFKKEVIIPIEKPLEVEQMGLLESTIFGTFVIVKSLLK